MRQAGRRPKELNWRQAWTNLKQRMLTGRCLQSGKHQLRAKEADGFETKIVITDEMQEELDSVKWEELGLESMWHELFSRVGLSSEDPPRIVVSELLGEKEATMPPGDVAVLCRVHRFDAWRYYVSGTSLTSSFMSDYVITKENLESDEDLSSAINSGTDGTELLDILLAKLFFQDEGDGFYFGEA